ncbi:MAG: hypothetical protein EOO38_31605 [Cytophagaceae bacterium]|nr:MAG: hypothetical protein EOO38_31605 [Cytophagaceae bacterium]
MHNVLTVCLGNICRSPMAEGLLAAALPDRAVSSAGLGAMVALMLSILVGFFRLRRFPDNKT